MGMRISSGSSAVQGGAQAWQQRQQNFQALSQALSSNNMDAAKTAYASLSGNSSNNAASNPNSPFAQLGKALQTGDMSGAQKAFSQMKAGNGHHHHASTSSGSTAPTPASTPTATTGNDVNVYLPPWER